MMKKALLLTAMALAAACSMNNPPDTPRDLLIKRLSTFSGHGLIAYGHQDDLFYGHSWKVEDTENDALERSDVKDACGKYPMVMGCDLGGIELGSDKNLDGVPFSLMRRAVLAHTGRGGIVTISWHPRNPLTGGTAWDVSSDQVVKSILKGGGKEAEFRQWLQRAADFVESIGQEVPIIFRPWHENIAGWFWWGGDRCTAEEYQELFRCTWRYFTEERGLKNLLWCYSPNGPLTQDLYMSRYPGDDFVDILGTDIYEFAGDGPMEEAGIRFKAEVRQMLDVLTALGKEHGKLTCFSETGLEGLTDPSWWSQTLYPAIRDHSISYVLTWRNAHDNPRHFYAPWSGFEWAEDFRKFTEEENIVMLNQP